MNHARYRRQLVDQLNQVAAHVYDSWQPANPVTPHIVVTWVGSHLARNVGWTHRYEATLVIGSLSIDAHDDHVAAFADALAAFAPTTSAATASAPTITPISLDSPIDTGNSTVPAVTATIFVTEPSTT